MRINNIELLKNSSRMYYLGQEMNTILYDFIRSLQLLSLLFSKTSHYSFWEIVSRGLGNPHE